MKITLLSSHFAQFEFWIVRNFTDSHRSLNYPNCIVFHSSFANTICKMVFSLSEQPCGEDEEMYDCKPFCNLCNPPRICPRICIKGCFCKKGLVLSDDGKCIEKSQCGKRPPICKANEQYYDCIPSCTNTCENFGRKDVACPAICTSGCFCKEGLVKRGDGQCVTPDNCNEISKF